MGPRRRRERPARPAPAASLLAIVAGDTTVSAGNCWRSGLSSIRSRMTAPPVGVQACSAVAVAPVVVDGPTDPATPDPAMPAPAVAWVMRLAALAISGI